MLLQYAKDKQMMTTTNDLLNDYLYDMPLKNDNLYKVNLMRNKCKK